MIFTAVLASNLGVVIAVSAAIASIAVGFLAWKAKAGDIWESVAEGYKEQVQQRDAVIEDLRNQISESRERTAALEQQIASLKEHSQQAVLRVLATHKPILERIAAAVEGGRP